MISHALIDLPDGRKIKCEIRPSAKARSLRLKMTAREGLTVIAPKGLDEHQVVELVTDKRDWILAKLNQFDEVRHLLSDKPSARPEAFDLPALAETWRVEYRQTKGKTVGARTNQHGRVLIYGNITNVEKCRAALRRWLARRAKGTLVPWLESLAVDSGLRFSKVTIKNQRTRWGSCSSDGVISLNAKLLFLAPEQVRYVLIHELCHTLDASHSKKYWTFVRQFFNDFEAVHAQTRDAWKLVPAWAYARAPSE